MAKDKKVGSDSIKAAWEAVKQFYQDAEAGEYAKLWPDFLKFTDEFRSCQPDHPVMAGEHDVEDLDDEKKEELDRLVKELKACKPKASAVEGDETKKIDLAKWLTIITQILALFGK